LRSSEHRWRAGTASVEQAASLLISEEKAP
jgi:hypothetical protein